ncbi:cysteine dioxygenase [Actinomadura sp. WMMB 499]|uniref:cysteine dioxygenase n=1 Tax=Actinomadura sp. WMMB 499 TaxID=1219491 RepID=UPI001245D155|nr:cysteine dioxygenase [Actinomadura sp. WMMB 499]QFG21880.1 cysteine dioxygenase [Actinomadura sp. WMMB 499]
MVPDLTMRGQDDPHGRAVTARPPTIGRLAARVHALAARPAEWWRLIGFDDSAPARIRLDDADGVPVWLTTWPPGHGATVDARVSTLIAGELAEIVITPDGVTERPLRANRVRVHAGSRALTNPGPAYAVSLHA